MSFNPTEFFKSGALISLSYEKLLIGWGLPFYRSYQEVDIHQPAFYFPDFFLTVSQPWIQYPQWLEISKYDLEQLLEMIEFSHSLRDYNWQIENIGNFKQAFEELSHSLQNNHLKKAVPYIFAHSSSIMTLGQLRQSLKKIFSVLDQKVGYVYGYWSEEKGLLGLTPELLFSHSQQQPNIVKTMALAGTCLSSDFQQAFLNSEKENFEHQIVVQGICQSLQPFGYLKRGHLQLLQLPQLAHFMTPIEVDLINAFDFDTMVKALHPTPALGAYPLEEGRVWLKNYQKHTPRNHYGAPVGVRDFSKGLSQCFVAIRNVQWNHLGMSIGAGCGVVKQSVFDKEWQEIYFKIQAIRHQLCL